MSIGAPQDRLSFLQCYAPNMFKFEETFDITTFDEFTKSLYHSDGAENQFAKEVLEEFLKDDRSWRRVDSILEFSSSDESRFYALLILEKLVKSRWKVLPNDQRVGIRDYIVQQIIGVGSQENAFESRKLYLNKLICVLVEILKYEWPRRWPEFIDEIVQSSKISENLSLVNMKILRLLSEEIFIFSSQMNHNKTKYLREAFVSQFPSLYSHIFTILTESANVHLILESLKTLAGFMPYIPRRFIFQSSLIDLLLDRFFKEPLFSNDTLACLSEIMTVDDKDAISAKQRIYSNVLEKMTVILPHTFDFNLAYSHGTEIQQCFLRMLAMFFTQSLKDYQRLYTQDSNCASILDGLSYIHAATQIEDTEIFKICIEFWRQFSLNLRVDHTRSDHRTDLNIKMFLELIAPIFSKLRYTIITHMKRPEEVIIFVNEHGEVVRQFMRDTDSISLYFACKETLSNLTILNPEEVKTIIFERLDALMVSPHFSWQNLNSIGWAVGSISMSMPAEMERDFLVRVLKNLLTLCDEKRGKDNKAIIASNIMYVVQNYPRFLKPYYRFLKTVVNKLFEFMTETHEGVQDMACDALLKISRSCKFQLAKPQPDEKLAFIDECLPNLHSNLNLLNIHQLETVFEALGYIIDSVEDFNKAQNIIVRCLEPYMFGWNTFVASLNTYSIDNKDFDNLIKICTLLKISNAMCRTAGNPFEVFVSRVFNDMMNIYSVLSVLISQQISNLGPNAAMYSEVKVIRGFKRDVLNLLECFITKCHANIESARTLYFLPFVNVVLIEYSSSHASVRVPEVISATSAFICVLQSRISDQIVMVFQHLFDSTLSMINHDLQEFPEHRVNFFKLILAIVNSCFDALSVLNPSEFDFVMQSLFFGISHTTPNVSSVALGSLISIFKNMVDTKNCETAFVPRFYKTYFVRIVDHVLLLITDGMHASDLGEHAFILAHLFGQLDSNKIGVAVFETSSVLSDNLALIKEHSIQFLQIQHPHLTNQQLVLFVDGLLCFYRVQEQFIQHIRDFILQLNEYQGDDGEDLFVDDMQKEMNDVMARRLQEFAIRSERANDPRSLQDYHTTA